MSAKEAKEVEAALANLEGLAKKGHAPSHYVARHVLLALGKLMASGPEAESAPLVARARAAGEGAPSGWKEAWTEALDAELSMACGEFAQSLDPRYLDLPNYDLDYTKASRARLEDRLRAASALGVALSPRETDVLALADQVLGTFLERRGARKKERPDATPGN